MFGISLPELLVIFAICLLIFGPDKLPELASKLGRLSAELRRHSDGIRREFYNSVYKPADIIQGETNRALSGLRGEILAIDPLNPGLREGNCETAKVASETQSKVDQSDESNTPGKPDTTT